MDVLASFTSSFQKNSWYRPGLKLLCACSGGLDSTVMFHLLTKIPAVELSIVHFDHQFRGKHSDSDREFVSALAQYYDVDFHIVRNNVSEYAQKHHLSFEEAGSRLRKSAFLNILEELKYDYIVSGQHLDDQIETILINLYLGTGIRGLSGIGKYQERHIRPLLKYRKLDLAEYARRYQIEYCEDGTNANPKYLRNNIRSQLIPILELESNNQLQVLMSKISQLGRSLSQNLEISSEIVDNIDNRKPNIVKISLGMGKLVNYFSPIQKMIFDSAFQSISFVPQGLSNKHFMALKSLLPEKAVGKEIHLPHSINAFRDRYQICLFRKSDLQWNPVVMTDASTAMFPFFHFDYCATRILEHVKDGSYFWYSHHPNQYCFRQSRDGDTLKLSRSGKRLSVMQILQEAHVAPHLKQYFPVLEYGGEIQWIPGIRTSASAMVTPTDMKKNKVRHCLRAKFQEGTFE